MIERLITEEMMMIRYYIYNILSGAHRTESELGGGGSVSY